MKKIKEGGAFYWKMAPNTLNILEPLKKLGGCGVCFFGGGGESLHLHLIIKNLSLKCVSQDCNAVEEFSLYKTSFVITSTNRKLTKIKRILTNPPKKGGGQRR